MAFASEVPTLLKQRSVLRGILVFLLLLSIFSGGAVTAAWILAKPDTETIYRKYPRDTTEEARHHDVELEHKQNFLTLLPVLLTFSTSLLTAAIHLYIFVTQLSR